MKKMTEDNIIEKIKAATKKIYSENITKNISISAISKEAKISRTTFYKHFNNVEEVINLLDIEIEDSDKQIKKIILNSALDLFSNFGYSNTTMEQIAKASDINKAVIYNYFDTKSDLFDEIIQKYSAFHLLCDKFEIKEGTEEEMIEAILEKIGLCYLKSFDREETVKFNKIVISESVRDEKFGQMMFEQFFTIGFPKVKNVFEYYGFTSYDYIYKNLYAFFSMLSSWVAFNKIMNVPINRQNEKMNDKIYVVKNAVNVFLYGCKNNKLRNGE